MTQRRATLRVTRVLLSLAACTLIGAVATVLGTWAMAVWGPPRMPPLAHTIRPTTEPWPMPLPASLRKEIEAAPTITPGLIADEDAWSGWRGLRPAETTSAESNWCTSEIYAVSVGYVTSLLARDKVPIWMQVFQVGWPRRAMAYANVWSNGRTAFDDSLIEGLPVPKLLNRSERRLPLTPLWPGFAINTLVYAAAAWGMWQIPLALRRRRRRKTNRCVNCGYDRKGLKSDAACPECGTISGPALKASPSPSTSSLPEAPTPGSSHPPSP